MGVNGIKLPGLGGLKGGFKGIGEVGNTVPAKAAGAFGDLVAISFCGFNSGADGKELPMGVRIKTARGTERRGALRGNTPLAKPFQVLGGGGLGAVSGDENMCH